MKNFIPYLFRLYDLGGPEEEHNPVIFTLLQKENLPTPCPGIMRQKDIDIALSGDIPSGRVFSHAIVPFSPRKEANFRQRIGVPPNLIKMEPKQLITGHRVETMNKFPLNSLKEVSHIANERGGTSFIVTDASAIKETLKKLPTKMEKQFKFFESFGHNLSAHGKMVEDDELQLFLTFLDLRYCIPIYNTKKLDGVGLMVGLFYPISSDKTNQLIYTDMYIAIASNFKENIFIIDGGSKINNRGGFTKALTDHMVNNFKRSITGEGAKKVAAGPAIKKAKAAAKKVSYTTTTTAYFGGNSSSDTSTTSTW